MAGAATKATTRANLDGSAAVKRRNLKQETLQWIGRSYKFSTAMISRLEA